MLDEPLFQFITINPHTNKTLTTVAKIRTRRERIASTNRIVLVDCGDFFVFDVLVSDRNLGVDRAGFAGTRSLFGAASKGATFAARGSVAGSIAIEVIGSVARVSLGSVAEEIDDNTASEHHSGSISNFGSDSDTASSRKTRMSLREIDLGLGKL